jgi:hypothetical protein
MEAPKAKKLSYDFYSTAKGGNKAGFTSQLNSLKYTIMTKGMSVQPEEIKMNPIYTTRGTYI